MPNVVKYKNVDWPDGTPVAGERLATNGHYTGEHLGAVTQDAKVTMTPHKVEEGVVRLGTLMQDAKDTNFPVKATE